MWHLEPLVESEMQIRAERMRRGYAPVRRRRARREAVADGSAGPASRLRRRTR